MTKPRPPYLQKEITRHGKIIWYVRRNKETPRIRIHGDYGSDEFMQNYAAALHGERVAGKDGKIIIRKEGTFAWLVAQYRKSAEWGAYSKATRRQRDNIFAGITDKIGDMPFKSINRKSIIASRDARADHPAAATNFMKAMSGLFKWAAEQDYVEENPCLGIKGLKSKNNGGFKAWTEEDVALYRNKWTLGTKERVWFDVLLYTGLRRGDAARLGVQHVRNGIITITTEKSGYRTVVALPVLPELEVSLKTGKTGDLIFICGANGLPLTKESFGNCFRDACRAAGIKKSAHGVRKLFATRLANAGATQQELKKSCGWTDDAMPSLYTRTADGLKLAKNAIAKLQAAGNM